MIIRFFHCLMSHIYEIERVLLVVLRLQIRFGKWHSLSTQLNWSPGVLTGLRPSHTTHKTTKNAVIFHTHYNFFCITATILSTVFCMSNDFPTDFFRETFAVLCVVCVGL